MSDSTSSTRTIKVDYLARVEGEGALYVKVVDDNVEEVKLRIFEPPRFFEAMLRGRKYTEAPDITARICGICPIAYMMGASQAMEMACGVDSPGGAIRELRRLIYCGEWIESHVLHIYMLHAPDFLGYTDAMAMAKDHRDTVVNALRLKKIGNQLMKVIGGREIHPVNLRIGGLYKAPSKSDLAALIPELEWGLAFAQETVAFVSGLPFPDFEFDYEFMALQHPDEYPITEGRLTSNKGVDIDINEYDDWLTEEHVAHSTALQSRSSSGGRIHTGPLARFALNREKLPPLAQAAAENAGLADVVMNPFKSIVVRAVEVVFAFEEALRIIRNYEPPTSPFVEVTPKAGTGYGATEAPRGICYHRYSIDDEGVITDAKIVAPTSVNQATIEQDLLHYIPPRIHLDDEQLKHECEQAIRNYDPCISCSAHFLNLTVDRH
jgi:sulfhydrogenase subunit alpha